MLVFKGRRTDRAVRIRYTLRSVEAIEYLELDIGGLVAVYGIRRGVFDEHETIESLVNGDEINIRWKDEALQWPFFVQAKPRGLGITKEPMRDENQREYLQRIADQVGLRATDGRKVTMYGFRRNLGTAITRVYGADSARKALGHEPSSTALERSYDDGLSYLDFVGGLLGEEQVGPLELRAGMDLAVTDFQQRKSLRSSHQRNQVCEFPCSPC